MIPADPELISRCLAHDDTRAFGELVLRHQSAVRRFLRHLSRGDGALADDLAQETFLKAHKSLAGFRAESRFVVWLLGIAYNLHRNSSRKQRQEKWATATLLEDVAAPPTASLSDLRSDLASALGQLAAAEQLALQMNFEVGLSHAEIAAALGLPVGTVKTHIARGKERLHELLLPWKVSP